MLPLCQTPHVARVLSQPLAATSKLSCQQRAMTNIQQSSTRVADTVPSSSSSGKCSKSALAAIIAAAIALQPIQAGLELLSPPTARAHVAIDKLMQQQQQQALQQISTGGFDPGASAAAPGGHVMYARCFISDSRQCLQHPATRAARKCDCCMH